MSRGTISNSLTYIELESYKVVGIRKARKIFEEMITRNFLNLMKIISKRSIIPSRKNMEKIKPRHIIIKLHIHTHTHTHTHTHNDKE